MTSWQTKKYLKNTLKIIITLGILFFLIDNIGWSKITSTIITANLLILLLAIILKVVSLALTAVNIKIFLDGLKKKVRFWKVFVYSNLAWSLGLFLPGRIGEFSLVYFLKEENLTFGESTAIAILDKISTFIILSLFSLLAILKYFNFYLAVRFAVISLLILIISLFILSNQKTRHFIKRYLLKSYSFLFTGFYTSLKELFIKNKKLFFFNLIITTVKWFSSFLIIKTIFIALGASVSLVDVSYITAFSLLISLIPLSIGGLGIREGVAVYLFNLISVKPEITLSTYLLTTILNYFFGFFWILLNLKRITVNKNNFSFEKEKLFSPTAKEHITKFL